MTVRKLVSAVNSQKSLSNLHGGNLVSNKSSNKKSDVDLTSLTLTLTKTDARTAMKVSAEDSTGFKYVSIPHSKNNSAMGRKNSRPNIDLYMNLKYDDSEHLKNN